MNHAQICNTTWHDPFYIRVKMFCWWAKKSENSPFDKIIFCRIQSNQIEKIIYCIINYAQDAPESGKLNILMLHISA